MKRKDMLIVLCFIVAAAALYLLPLGKFFDIDKKPSAAISALTNGSFVPQETQMQPNHPLENDAGSSPVPTLAPAKCYLLITVGDVIFEPYPLLKEQDMPITQVNGMQNVVHITPDGFYMASATCDNSDCIYQGKVTLENRDVRLLGNQVICLPNKVMLELLTPEEALVVWKNAHDDGEK